MVVSSSVPLYHLVRQEYIPTDVDVAEFDVNLNAPEGSSLALMDEVMRAEPKSRPLEVAEVLARHIDEAGGAS